MLLVRIITGWPASENSNPGAEAKSRGVWLLGYTAASTSPSITGESSWSS